MCCVVSGTVSGLRWWAVVMYDLLLCAAVVVDGSAVPGCLAFPR